MRLFPPGSRRARHSRLAASAAALLLLAACHSSAQKAERAEALSDRAMAMGDYRTAAREMRLAIKQNDAEARYWTKLARIGIAAGDYSTAYSAYNQALGLDPNNIEALQAVAQIALASDNTDTAKQYIETLMVLSPQDPQGRFMQAKIALQEGDLDKARTIVDGLIKDGVDADEIEILKARILDVMGKPAEGAAALEPLVDASQKKEDLLEALLLLYQHAGNDAGVRSVYRRLVAVAPQNFAYALQYAHLLYRGGDKAQAEALAAGVEKYNPDNGNAKLAVARFWADAAPPAVAMPQMLRIAGTGDLSLKAAIANLLVRIGQANQAFALLDPLMRDADVEAENVSAQVAYASVLRALGRSPQARARIDAVLDFDKTNAHALLLRAELALASRDLNQALADAQLYTSVAPTVERGALLVAQVYAARGDRVLADQSYARAVANFRDSPNAVAAYRDYLMGSGRAAQAVTIAARFMRAHPALPIARGLFAQSCKRAGEAACKAGAAAL